ncbi:hypothetical protein MASR2M78_33260 [Treponema sp.]
MENKTDETKINFGASARGEVSWFVPSPLFDKLYLGGAWGSGLDGDLGAFLPITGPDAGKVFDVPLIGVATIHAGYFIKLMPQFSADVSITSFIRQGSGVYDDEINAADDSAYLGTEAYASMLFSVSSELSISMGTGLFFPSTDAFVEDTKNRFMVTATAIVSF